MRWLNTNVNLLVYFRMSYAYICIETYMQSIFHLSFSCISSSSSGGGFKKLMAKAKTIPVPRITGLAQVRSSKSSATECQWFLAALAALYLTLVSGSLGATFEFWHKEWLLRLEVHKTYDQSDVWQKKTKRQKGKKTKMQKYKKTKRQNIKRQKRWKYKKAKRQKDKEKKRVFYFFY